MQVDLIASTRLEVNDAPYVAGYVPHPNEKDADELAEFAGRLCYRSWRRPNPATASNRGYLANILEHKHFSTIEHASATFLIQGVSRSLTHELVRHRHFSFSQVSQRYVDSSQEGFVDHPVLSGLDDVTRNMVRDQAAASVYAYEIIVGELMEKGYTKKEARGAARQVLPEGTLTDIVVTGNHRSWMEFIDKRYSVFADHEIRELAGLILVDLKRIAPNIYQGFELKTFDSNKVGEN